MNLIQKVIKLCCVLGVCACVYVCVCSLEVTKQQMCMNSNCLDAFLGVCITGCWKLLSNSYVVQYNPLFNLLVWGSLMLTPMSEGSAQKI